MEAFSRRFLSFPYRVNPLAGSPDTPEVFTVSFDAFDCVTYVETVLALSLASNPANFERWLRRIRYVNGRLEWKSRNHYMTGWIRNNVRLGAVRKLRAQVPSVVKTRVLSMLPGLLPEKVQFRCVAKPALNRLEPYLRTGDLIFFASTRKHLDVFHCGILVRTPAGLNLRHASRSRGSVQEELLSRFLKANRMAGIIVVRPNAGATVRG
jgi:hypothetical protein